MRFIGSVVFAACALVVIDAAFFGGVYFDAVHDFVDHFRASWK